MRWIILIGNENFDMSTVKSINHYGCIEYYDVSSIKGRYYVNFGEDHIFYDYNEILDDFDEDELNKIPYSKPHINQQGVTLRNSHHFVMDVTCNLMDSR